ncbi:MAG: hypothetical protein JXR76_17665 [Deltaproteobacteria bacterium]|nr:hypothetical protein [Deltaproteobacteria bacterium]
MKKVIAWTLLMAGMSAAALAAARLGKDATVAQLFVDAPFWIGMGAVVLAILVNRSGQRHKGDAQTETQINVTTQIADGLDEILARLSKHGADDDLERRVSVISSLQEDQIFQIADAKQRLIAAKGFSFYAHFMSDFAVAERFLSRAWSAAVDGYPDESNTYLDKAQTFFMQSKKVIADQ